MSLLPDDRQALHRENLRITGHLTGMAMLKKRHRPTAEDSVPASTAPPPMIPAVATRPVAKIKPALPVVIAPPVPITPPPLEPTDCFFDDFESEIVVPKQLSDDSVSFDSDSTAFESPQTANETGRLSASAVETSDELRRPESAAPQGEAINDILDGFNW